MTDMFGGILEAKGENVIQIHSVFEIKLIHPITNLEFYKMYIFNDSGSLFSFF